MADLNQMAKDCRANSERWFPWPHDPTNPIPLTLHWALGLTGEAGEVANKVKKALRAHSRLPLAERVSAALFDELPDIFVYLLLLADELGIDMEDAYERKVAICHQRWDGQGQDREVADDDD